MSCSRQRILTFVMAVWLGQLITPCLRLLERGGRVVEGGWCERRGSGLGLVAQEFSLKRAVCAWGVPGGKGCCGWGKIK